VATDLDRERMMTRAGAAPLHARADGMTEEET
jgi:hypothetical protein